MCSLVISNSPNLFVGKFNNFFNNIIKKYPVLNKEQEYSCLKKIINRSHYHKETVQKALDVLVYSNQKLIIKYAYYYYRKNPHTSLDDLISCGNVGLMMAILNYKIKYIKKNKFSSYAVPCIVHSMLDYIKKSSCIIKLPNEFKDYKKEKNKIKFFSIYQKVSNDIGSNLTYEDIIEDKKFTYYNKNYHDVEFVKEIFKLLTPKDRQLLHYMFIKRYTLKQASHIYHITIEGTRLRLKRLLKKLKKRFGERKIINN